MDAGDTTRRRFLRAAIVIAVPAAYFSYVFRFWTGAWRTSGLGDWIDPYFINFLLEHWHTSVWHLKDPASPPMYFPMMGTLGYSHGLILYAPFYLIVRPFLHPFSAYTMALFLVLETGSVCLYLLLRKYLELGFLEALLLCGFFFTSANIMNGSTGTWSQTLSVFVIPPILLLAFVSARMPAGRPRLAVAWVAGLLATLLYVQDFYTGHFALLFSVLLLPGPLALVLSTLLLAGAAVFATAPMRAGIVGLWTRERSWALAFGVGAICGGLVFLWCYLGAYQQHPRFPPEQLMQSITRLHPDTWHSITDLLREANRYASLRSFELIFLMGLLAWVPWFRVAWRTRWYSLWCACLAFVAFAMPIRTSHFSIWRLVFEPLPGFSVVRDPVKVIYVYELAAALSIGVFLSRLPRRSVLRVSIVVLMAGLMATDWNTRVFKYVRPIAAFDRWVEPPIAIDPSCRSFFIKSASDEYMSRSGHMWTLYGLDSAFIALHYSIPTLNGYSAWAPDRWGLANPQGDGYMPLVELWIAENHLRDVCELDIDKRTMTPHISPPPVK